jgi:hypothetical protein
MGLRSETRTLFKALRGNVGANDFVFPHGRALRVPRDIPLRLRFPKPIESPEHKVIYTLWREGEQCYCNLRILTGLSEAEIRPALRKLLDNKRVVRKQAPAPSEYDEEMSSFTLLGDR